MYAYNIFSCGKHEVSSYLGKFRTCVERSIASANKLEATYRDYVNMRELKVICVSVSIDEIGEMKNIAVIGPADKKCFELGLTIKRALLMEYQYDKVEVILTKKKNKTDYEKSEKVDSLLKNVRVMRRSTYKGRGK